MNRSSLLTQDCVTVLRLNTNSFCYGWEGWKCLHYEKFKFARHLEVMAKNVLWMTFPKLNLWA